MSEEMNKDENLEEVVTSEETQTTAADEMEPVEVSKEESLQIKVDEMEDQMLRLQAEMVNMRNRFQKERETSARYRVQDLAKELLPALDNLDRALETEVTEESAENLKKGVEMVRDSILTAFGATGIEEIGALGEKFDPNLHQAVQTMAPQEGQETDEVIHVLQKGYKLHDRVLRPTMVIVAQ